MKTKLTVKTAFGTFQRATGRPYKFVVVSTGISAATITARYDAEGKHDGKHFAEYQAVLVALQQSGKPFARRLDGTSIAEANYMKARGLTRGTIEFADGKADSYEGIGWHSVAEWQDFANQIRATMESNVERRNVAIAKEQARGYHAIQWSSRLELARTYANQLRERGFENVRIIGVQTSEVVQ